MKNLATLQVISSKNAFQGKAEPSREAGCHSEAPFTKVSGWRGQKHHVWPFSAETLPHPWPNRKVKGESLRRHIHTLISKALLLFFGLFVPSLFTF